MKIDDTDVDDNGWTKVHHAAQNGKYEEIKALAERGMNIQYLKTHEGKNCLHIAAANGQSNLCKTLIFRHEFDINMIDNRGWTALHFSVQNGSHELVKFFTDNGADIHQKANEGVTCLHIAATHGHLNLCKTLKNKYELNLHVTDDYGCNALHRSAVNGSYDLVKFFADNGTEIYLKTREGINCLHIAAAHGHLNLCKALMKIHNFKGDIPHNYGWTALHLSAQNGNYDLVKCFADNGTDIFLKMELGNNCLHIAARNGHLKLCEKLVAEYKFDMNMVNNLGWTALHHSAHNGSYELIEFFIKMGADIHLKTNDGSNCFHIAAFSGHLNLCETLIDIHSFDVDMTNSKGWTGLHYSAKCGSHDLINFFVDKKINIYQKTKDGMNCLHIAASKGHFNLCKTLIEELNFNVHIGDNRKWSALHHAALNGSYELMKYFIAKGTNVSLKTKHGKNCLHIAASNGHLDLCKTLIDEINFDVNIADDEGCTALHGSAQSGNDELFGFIADKGTDVFLKIKGGQNCLHIAASKGHFNLCKALIEKLNFNVDMVDNKKWTVLHHAALNGSYELMKYFITKGTDALLKTKDGLNCIHIAASNGYLNLCKTLID